MVFHGCVDGFSRSIIYLSCENNNRASTVLSLFWTGVQQFGLPSRVRSDHGRENIGVARFMLERRGIHRHSFLTGRSVHNQWIERLWAELNRVVSSYYIHLFTFMEDEGILDSVDELHLFCLHYVYIPRVQRSVGEFRDQWNNHGLSTQGGHTPLQLWQQGVLHNAGLDTTVNDIFEVDFDFGIEEDGPLPELQMANNVIVSQNTIVLNDTTMNIIHGSVNPLENDGNHGIDLFLRLVHIVEQRLS